MNRSLGRQKSTLSSKNTGDPSIQLRLFDRERSSHGGAHRDLDGNHHAALGRGFDDPAESLEHDDPIGRQ